MTGYNTQIGCGLYRLQLETDNKEAYLAVQDVARKYVDAEQNKEVVAKMETTTSSGWISVKDRLPPPYSYILMHFAGVKTDEGSYVEGPVIAGMYDTRADKNGDEIADDFCFWIQTDLSLFTECDQIPLHWMPLPEPPEEEPK